MNQPTESRIANREPRSIFFIAGEASGDAHAADVIRTIKARAPDVHCLGAGGPKMRDAGMELALDLTEHAVLGFVEVLRNYFKFRRFFFQMLDLVAERKPNAVVLVDSPGFNLRFAKALRQRFKSGDYRPKVIYYISPQVWAWAERRVRLIERCVNLLISIFPFEKAWYAQRAPNLRVEFVGHPMVSRFAQARSGIQNQESEITLALLPGSREREVRAHWPILRDAVQGVLLNTKARIVVLAASDRTEALLREHGAGLFEISRNGIETLNRATAAIAASGTATLECAYFGVPTVVIYKVAWPTYLLGRMLVKVNHLAMPNVLAGEAVYPEFIQHHARADAIAKATLGLLEDEQRRRRMKLRLAEIIASLGGEGASERAAELVLGEIGAKAIG
jgi:lipid-A-disaccharide synthase